MALQRVGHSEIYRFISVFISDKNVFILKYHAK